MARSPRRSLGRSPLHKSMVLFEILDDQGDLLDYGQKIMAAPDEESARKILVADGYSVGSVVVQNME